MELRSSWTEFETPLSQAERSPRQCWIDLYVSRDNAEYTEISLGQRWVKLNAFRDSGDYNLL